MTEISNYNKKIETLFEQAKAGDKTALDELLTEYTFFMTLLIISALIIVYMKTFIGI